MSQPLTAAELAEFRFEYAVRQARSLPPAERQTRLRNCWHNEMFDMGAEPNPYLLGRLYVEQEAERQARAAAAGEQLGVGHGVVVRRLTR